MRFVSQAWLLVLLRGWHVLLVRRLITDIPESFSQTSASASQLLLFSVSQVLADPGLVHSKSNFSHQVTANTLIHMQ
jgi:hypothetical protein